MKRLSTILALVAVCAAGLAEAGPGKHLFILSGQSNMQGLNPQTSFIPAVEKEFGKDGVIVVKDAQSGRPIRDWYRDWKPAGGKAADANNAHGKLYDRLLSKVKPAIKDQKIASVTFVWMQGDGMTWMGERRKGSCRSTGTKRPAGCGPGGLG